MTTRHRRQRLKKTHKLRFAGLYFVEIVAFAGCVGSVGCLKTVGFVGSLCWLFGFLSLCVGSVRPVVCVGSGFALGVRVRCVCFAFVGLVKCVVPVGCVRYVGCVGFVVSVVGCVVAVGCV